MRPRKQIQALSVCGRLLRKKGQSITVPSDEIADPKYSTWIGKLIDVRALRNGKSQVVRIR